MRLGTVEIIAIVVVALLVLGPTQIPKLAKLFGKASRKFKEGLEEEDQAEADGKAEEAPADHAEEE
ncbi:MAG: twin-arginine translocase TatA/TatE family subunit [Lachnospiraceae bacterium]|nr:twin-arginine translocase TatA/TatE family subunit [Lachnospiraceae bacterium]